MSDLRAKVEAHLVASCRCMADKCVSCETGDAVLALIPEGAVLVTEETLAAALQAVLAQFLADVEADVQTSELSFQEHAAAILRHLREGTE